MLHYPQKMEGYWYSTNGNNYSNIYRLKEFPKVEERIKPTKVSEEFIAKLEKLEALQKSAKKLRHYMGYSKCTVCQCLNGTSEYYTDKWAWPTGYLHYLLEHNVQTTEEFYNYVMNS